MAMSAEHKQALAQGRKAASAVKAFLVALEENAPKRGRKRTPESIRARLDKIEAALDEASTLQRLQLIQERMDLDAELKRMEAATTVDMTALEADFIQHAKTYADNKGISYPAWREIGVEPKVLAEAGIKRTRD